MQNAIVLVIDGWSAGQLGPYGNSWVDTPELNRLAAGATLWEHALVDTPDLSGVYHSYWHGTHALSSGATSSGKEPPNLHLARLLDEVGVSTTLVSDDPQVTDHATASAFAEHVSIPVEDAETAGSIEETHTAAAFSVAIDVIRQAQSPFMVWCHLRGAYGAWDAPHHFRERFADEEDPSPPRFVEPPDRTLPPDVDPDEVLGFGQAYAGQSTLIDSCLGVLLDVLEDSALSDSTLLAVTSPRGFPLGEHHRVGFCDGACYGELLHVPWLIRFPGGQAAGQRCQGLVQPPDLFATLAEHFQQSPSDSTWGRRLTADDPDGRVQAVSTYGAARTMRTPAWMLVRPAELPPQLYSKPDDRWEVNEISDRCPQISEQLTEVLAQFEAAAAADDPSLLQPLSEELLEGLE